MTFDAETLDRIDAATAAQPGEETSTLMTVITDDVHGLIRQLTGEIRRRDAELASR